ncbi:hypothetical protein CLHOM_00710 [Clostridium homopropionicum DSM 5847]|uniref:ABC-2 family transporter protein n=1 Tax=Clostridium homopropionicum DSM 5847 TaxID=1121318 RepID=A0A0L6ZEJ7_9CLOT|nr:ABC-2 transporter permease [Clostridium homopropionicum]KOA21400.1 hypothetical protein CLHOM_00710 [Clostridium homopropionicum DSM 5847]SFG11125.1 ABC-2 family transporter protein [Clostridium homopropionicum]
MLNLIKKDFALTFNFKTLFIFTLYFIFLITIADALPSDNKYILTITTIAYFISTESFIYDDKTKGEYIINSLPLTRKEVVLSKYLSIGIYIIVALFFTSLLGGIIASLKIFSGLTFINLRVIKLVLIATIAMVSISFPLLFKYNYRKTKVINILLYLGFYTLINTASNIIGSDFVITYKAFLDDNLFKTKLICLLGIIFILIISITISLKFYENKDI